MQMFIKPYTSMPDIIKYLANKESEIEHAKYKKEPLPIYIKPVINKEKVGWKVILRELLV